MPLHDWTRVEPGIFHHFHQSWMIALSDTLNDSLLPNDYYALAEQLVSGLGPDVLALQETDSGTGGENVPSAPTGVLLAPPKIELTAETENEHFRKKQDSISVRHISDDRVVAVVEVISPSNKGSQYPFATLIEKAKELLSRGIHLLISDPLPPGPRDPHGLHGAIWEELTGIPYSLPEEKPLTFVAYEADRTIRAYAQNLAVGDHLPDMPLFLEPGAHIELPLEHIYQSAFRKVPRRWQRVLETPA